MRWHNMPGVIDADELDDIIRAFEYWALSQLRCEYRYEYAFNMALRWIQLCNEMAQLRNEAKDKIAAMRVFYTKYKPPSAVIIDAIRHGFRENVIRYSELHDDRTILASEFYYDDGNKGYTIAEFAREYI
jgi:hypothetical protein